MGFVYLAEAELWRSDNKTFRTEKKYFNRPVLYKGYKNFSLSGKVCEVKKIYE